MSESQGLNRRSFFLRNAQLTALVGAVGTGASLALAADSATTGGRKFDFDTPYSRFGTDSTKWDEALKTNNIDHLVAGMGIADMDFRCAPAITKALEDRVKHENWGYLSMPDTFVKGIVAWNKKRYGIDVKPEAVGITTGVHPGLIAALRAFAPANSKVLLMTPT